MSHSRHLQKAQRLMRTIQTPQDMETLNRASYALTEGGGIDPSAARAIVPLIVIPFWVPGTLVAANNVAMEFVVPQKYRVVRSSARVKAAPTGSSLSLRFTRNNVALTTVLIFSGNTSNGLPPAGPISLDSGDIIRVDVVVPGATLPGSDLTMMLTVQPDIAG